MKSIALALLLITTACQESPTAPKMTPLAPPKPRPPVAYPPMRKLLVDTTTASADSSIHPQRQ